MVPRAKALLDGMESWSGWKFGAVRLQKIGVLQDGPLQCYSTSSNWSSNPLFGEEISSQSVPLPVINRVMTPLSRGYIPNYPFIFDIFGYL